MSGSQEPKYKTNTDMEKLWSFETPVGVLALTQYLINRILLSLAFLSPRKITKVTMKNAVAHAKCTNLSHVAADKSNTMGM